MSRLGNLVVFVFMLAMLKFFFGWNISIIGSLALTLVLSALSGVVDRR